MTLTTDRATAAWAQVIMEQGYLVVSYGNDLRLPYTMPRLRFAVADDEVVVEQVMYAYEVATLADWNRQRARLVELLGGVAPVPLETSRRYYYKAVTD